MPKLLLVDTNVLVRFLVGDHPEHLQKVQQWFKEAESGKRSLIIVPLVIAETCFVLESVYTLKRKEIAQALQVLVSQKWLKVEDREVLQLLWPHYLNGLHFVDSYLVTKAQVQKVDVLTFDKELKGLIPKS